MDKPKVQMQFQDLYARMYPGKAVKSVTFIVTHQCNLRCSYCYETNKSEAHMTEETTRRCVDLLFQEDERGDGLVTPENADGLILDFIGGGTGSSPIFWSRRSGKTTTGPQNT